MIFSMENGLRKKIPAGKKVIANGVYSSEKENGNMDLLLPCIGDSPEFHKFKSRLRARHETLNGRLKDYRILSDTFRYDVDNHVFVFEAVLVLVQYAMDHDHPIFDGISYETSA